MTPTLQVFIHSSIKTRIETVATSGMQYEYNMFLYIVPLKQGLKRLFHLSIDFTQVSFYT